MGRRTAPTRAGLRHHAVSRAVSIYRRTPGTSMREAMRQANIDEGKHTRVTFGALQRALHPPSEPPAPAGRRTLIDATNELKLKEAILFYQGRGFNITTITLSLCLRVSFFDRLPSRGVKRSDDR